MLNARWNVPTSKSATEKMKIHAPSTRRTDVRFNSISESPDQPNKYFPKRQGYSERDHNGGFSTYLTYSEGHGTMSEQ